MDFLICSESVNSSKPGHTSGLVGQAVSGESARERNLFWKAKADFFLNLQGRKEARVSNREAELIKAQTLCCKCYSERGSVREAGAFENGVLLPRSLLLPPCTVHVETMLGDWNCEF